MHYLMISFPWLVALVPGAFLYLVHLQYRSVLYGRRQEIASIMSRGQTFGRYLEAFRSSGSSTGRTLDQVIDTMFYRKQGRGKYYLPLAMNGIFAGVFLLLALLRAGFHLGLPEELEKIALKTPRETIVGLAGAFVWGLYEVLRRFDAVDLSPSRLQMIWLRMLVVAVLSPMVSMPFTDSVKPIIAFAIGAFPITELFDFVKGRARDQLKMTSSRQPAEEPTLYKLQGLSEGMVEKLLEEGVESITHVATADPIKLLMTTNIEWKTILDIIDQAILFGYFGEKKEMLRPFGIRGAIELGELQEDIEDKDPLIRQAAQDLIDRIAAKLDQDKLAILNAIRNAYEDVQVELLADLWGEMPGG